jgi:dihydroxy-acid dehydratase
MCNNSFNEEEKKKLRSQRILGRDEWSDMRATFKGMGFGDNDLERPVIGVANTWSEINPGHTNLRMLAEKVKSGIYRAGGTPVEFGTIGICDGVPTGNEGNYYVLPHREIITNSIEAMTEGNRLDGIVLMGSCDKIVPALLMAAARMNIPAIVVNGGPMLSGPVFNGRKSDIVSPVEAMGLRSIGECSYDALCDLEDTCTPTCGSCSYMGTANTMCCLSEVLGLTLSGTSMIPAVFNDRIRASFKAGERIVDLVRKNITVDKLITKESIKNAIKVLMAIGGSTNAVLHLSAIAHEAGIDTSFVLDTIDELSYNKVPLLLKVNPSSEYDVTDFHYSGGVPQVMKEMKSILNLDCLTVDGNTIGENIDGFRNKYGEVDRVILRPLDNPFSTVSSLSIIKGNLAPDTGVAKPNTTSHTCFTGEAIVFESEEACNEAVLQHKVREGHVIVIRYEGPKGGPGMREMYKALKLLKGQHLDEKTALITDGRFSGTNNGCFVGHISPEAADGGPIAIVEDGDKITIDFENRDLHLHLTEEEIAERFKNWSYEPKKLKGYLATYAKLANSANKGAILG